MKVQIEEIQWSWDHPIIQELLLKYYRDWLFSTPEKADETIQEVISLSSLETPSSILDIGCGLGYHAAAFAKRGFNVLAFDSGDRYISIAKENADKLDLQIDFRQMDCGCLEEYKRFNLAWAGAYCPGQHEPSEVVEDFIRIYDALIPGHWFYATVAGKARAPFSKKVRNWEEEEDCFMLEEEWTDAHFCYETSWFLYPDDRRIIKVVEVDRIYDVESIVSLLKEAGFTGIETYSDLISRKPAIPCQHFAFRCKRPEA